MMRKIDAPFVLYVRNTCLVFGVCGEHRRNWRARNDELDYYGRCIACSIRCVECGGGVEDVNTFEEYGRCRYCSIPCVVCETTVRSIDDLDDEYHCERCAQLSKEKRKVSVKLGSRTIEVDVTLGDTVNSIKKNITEAYARMTRNAVNIGIEVRLFYRGVRLLFLKSFLRNIFEINRNFGSGTDEIPSVIELTLSL